MHHSNGTLHLEGFKILGVGLNTLGDAKETLLIPVLFLWCLVDPKALLFGLIIEFIGNVHLEVPTLGTLLLFKGRFIVHHLSGNGPTSTFLFDVTKECTRSDGIVVKQSLEAAVDTAVADESVGITIVNLIGTFEESVTLMDT